MTSLEKHFKDLIGFGLAAVGLIFIVLAISWLAIHDRLVRKFKGVPVDAYPHL